jgi:predicted nucleic acid-binding protein
VTLIVDSSVIVKWFVDEPGRHEALKVLHSGDRLVCPDLGISEAANTLWKKARAGEINWDHARYSINELPGYFDEIIPCADLSERTFELAKMLAHQMFDCFFLAAAEREVNALLATADGPFIKKCLENGFADFLQPIIEEPYQIFIPDEKLAEFSRLIPRFLPSLAGFKTLGIPYDVKDMDVDHLRWYMSHPDSAIYGALCKIILDLDFSELRDLIAICYFGRSGGISGIEDELKLASFSAHIHKTNANWIIGYLQHFENGLSLLKRTRPELFNLQAEPPNG